jgi:hypothetical protein
MTSEERKAWLADKFMFVAKGAMLVAVACVSVEAGIHAVTSIWDVSRSEWLSRCLLTGGLVGALVGGVSTVFYAFIND